MIPSLLGSIPSPSRGVFYLGPLPLHLYGLTLAVAVVAATYFVEYRWRKLGHDPREISHIAVWAVVGGVVGARLYHVITDYQLYTHDPLKAFQIWSGGLAIWGAVLGGTVVVIWISRRRHHDTLLLVDAFAPGVILAQAIGRWGNYFNQELFGRPTTLPWGLEIDFAHRPDAYKAFSTFQPTFLYESLWCLLVLGVLLWAERLPSHKKGQTVALYITLYTAGRFVFENMRSDPAHVVAGLRINAWVSLVLCAIGLGWFLWLARHGQPVVRGTWVEPGDEPDERPAGSTGTPADEREATPEGR